MNNSNFHSNHTVLWALWVLASIVGWATTHTVLHVPSLSAAHEITPLIIAVTLDGVLVGIVIGSGQWFILSQKFRRFAGWIQVTTLLYPIGLFAGLLANIFLLYRQGSSMGMTMLVEGAGTFIIPAPSITLLIAGFIIGVGQWFILRSYLIPNFKNAILWTIGTMAGLGVGWFIGGSRFESIGLSQSISTVLGGIVMGFVNGSITGSILLILLKEHYESGPLPNAQVA